MKPDSQAMSSVSQAHEQRNVKRFRGGLVFKAHRLLYHSTLDSRVIKKKKHLVEQDADVVLVERDEFWEAP